MNDFWLHTISGFSGAFFAFVFIGLADYGKRRKNRYARHENSLVKLQWLFSDLINAIGANQYQLEEFRKTFAHTKTSDGVFVAPNRPQMLDFRDDALDGLGNIDLLNEVASFRHEIRTTNNDISTIWGVHERFLKMALRDQSRIPDYIENFEQCEQSAQLLEAAHAQLLDLAIRIQCVIRILIRDARRWRNKNVVFRVRSHYPIKIENLFLAEEEQLAKEEAESRRETARRLEGLNRRLGEIRKPTMPEST